MGAFGPHGGPITRTVVSLSSPSERADLREIKAVNEIEGKVLASEFENPSEHQIRLAGELNDLQTIIAENGQEFSALWLNRDIQSQTEDVRRPLLLMSGGFLSSFVTLDGKYRAYHMARQFPDHQILAFDQPGHGHSSRFTKEQRHAMSMGDISDVGWQLYTAAQDFIDADTVSEVYGKGESFSSRVLLEIARASRGRVLQLGKLALFELPGAEGDRRVDIHLSYFGFEWFRSSYYGAKIKWWKDHKQAFGQFIEEYSGHALPKSPRSFFLKDPQMAASNFKNSILGYGTGQAVLEQLVQDGVGVVRTTATKGRIDNLAHAEMCRRAMREETNGMAWGQIALLHESHDGSGFAPRARLAARLTDFSLRHAVALSKLSDSYPLTMRRVQSGTLLVPEEANL